MPKWRQVTEWHQANIGKIFGGDFHDPGCTWAKCGKKFSFDKTKISSKVIFFYLSVKMNRMAKIWCTVPRMIFVGGFEQPAVHLTGATAKKHFTRIWWQRLMYSTQVCSLVNLRGGWVGRGGNPPTHPPPPPTHPLPPPPHPPTPHTPPPPPTHPLLLSQTTFKQH